MRQIVDSLQAFVLQIGGPGLLVIAFLDSSFLSLPQINDLLVIWMVMQHKERMVYYAAMATLGSLGGCLVLYGLGKKGGEALIRRRFGHGRVERALNVFQRYGVLAVIVPALLPPPAPFKLFVLLAGVANVPRAAFVLAILVGRGSRYLAAGLLAVWYGDQAMELLQTHGRTVLRMAAAVILLGGLAYVLWRRKGVGSLFT